MIWIPGSVGVFHLRDELLRSPFLCLFTQDRLFVHVTEGRILPNSVANNAIVPEKCEYRPFALPLWLWGWLQPRKSRSQGQMGGIRYRHQVLELRQVLGPRQNLLQLTRNQFIPYGATLTNLFVKDKSGNEVDVVLGYDDAAYYGNQRKFPTNTPPRTNGGR